jgi:hypothetical protein
MRLYFLVCFSMASFTNASVTTTEKIANLQHVIP